MHTFAMLIGFVQQGCKILQYLKGIERIDLQINKTKQPSNLALTITYNTDSKSTRKMSLSNNFRIKYSFLV